MLGKPLGKLLTLDRGDRCQLGKPSLSVAGGDKASVVVNCKAGCSQDAVIKELMERGLWPSNRGEGGRHIPTGHDAHPHTVGLTVAQYAAAKKLDSIMAASFTRAGLIPRLATASSSSRIAAR